MNTIVTIALIVIALAVICAGIYFYVRDKTLDEIRAEVYQKFLDAEHNKKLTTGKKKMTWVLIQTRMLLPNWAQVFITDKLLEDVVEGWFRAIKDLLDDGKINSSDAGFFNADCKKYSKENRRNFEC